MQIERIEALSLVFATYVISILLFGAAYWRMYRTNRGVFAFAADIARGQAATFRTTAESRVVQLEHALTLLRNALTHGDNSGFPELTRVRKWYELGWRGVATLGNIEVGVSREVVGGPGAAPNNVLTHMRIEGADGRAFTQTLLGSSDLDPSTLPCLLQGWLAAVTEEYDNLTTRLKSLDTQLPDVWSLSDFLYFSLITQTTVGYGDILPNATAVRKIVSLQILVGYALLIVVLNIVVSG